MSWKHTPIGDLCDLVNGRAFKPSDWTKDGQKIVRIQNLNDPSKAFNRYDGEVKEKHIIGNGDILLSWSGTPGTSFGCFQWQGGKAVLNQHIFKVLVDPKQILPLFFMHAVNSQLIEMIELAHGGVGLRHITKGKLESIEIPTPPLNEQQRIVGRIREALDRVDEIRRLKGETRKQIGALFYSYLHEAEQKSGSSRAALEELIVASKNGRSIKATGGAANGRVLTLSSVRNPNLNFSTSKLVEMESSVAEKYAIKKNDVFISRANTIDLVGLSAIALTDGEPSVIYPDLMIRLVPDASRILPKYLMYSLRFPESRRQIKERATGSSQSMVKISGKRLRTVVVPIPPLDTQEAVVQDLDKALKSCSLLEAACEDEFATLLRAAILRQAFAGEL